MPISTDQRLFAAELKRWRTHRRFSQLELANRAEVSQRHLSYLETGRSRPSPEMVDHLSGVLDIPLRARNSLLHAAGFAPAYSEERLDGPALGDVRAGLHQLVEAHDPFPAYIVDRLWNLQDANTAALRFTELLVPTNADQFGGNVLRFFLHPDGARRRVRNWNEAAALLVERLAAECTHDPTDSELGELYDEVTGYPGVAGLPAASSLSAANRLLTNLHIEADGVSLRFHTTIAALLAPTDITLQELRIETLLPADAETADALRRWVG